MRKVLILNINFSDKNKPHVWGMLL